MKTENKCIDCGEYFNAPDYFGACPNCQTPTEIINNMTQLEMGRFRRLQSSRFHRILWVGRSAAGRLLISLVNLVADPSVRYQKYVIGKRGGVQKIIFSQTIINS